MCCNLGRLVRWHCSSFNFAMCWHFVHCFCRFMLVLSVVLRLHLTFWRLAQWRNSEHKTVNTPQKLMRGRMFNYQLHPPLSQTLVVSRIFIVIQSRLLHPKEFLRLFGLQSFRTFLDMKRCLHLINPIF